MNSEIRIRAEAGTLTTREIAIVLEMNQRYKEYLDDLEIADLRTDTNVVVKVDDETIKFSSIEDVAAWITANK